MKVAIITTFQDTNPGYSLTGIVRDQITLLERQGIEVHLFVSERYNGPGFGPDVVLHPSIPFSHLVDYTSASDLSEDHRDLAKKTAEVLVRELEDIDVIFTHDLIFIGWFLPYGMGCSLAGEKLPNARWLHWIHSHPTGMRDYWNFGLYGENHRIVFPNESERQKIAEHFRTARSNVVCIPHIKDIRSWFDFDDETCQIIDAYPALMQADITQIYPASVDRLEAKRVKEVIQIFSNFKLSGKSVCLYIANQWATTKTHKENIEKYKDIARSLGLVPGMEIIFSSDWKVDKNGKGKYETSVPKRILRELMLCSNLFIFPTREESFGLVLPEAALCGNLCIINRSLLNQHEVSGMKTFGFNFGSYENQVMVADENAYYHAIAQVILGRMLQNEVINHTTFVRQAYNYDRLWRDYYSPIIADLTNVEKKVTLNNVFHFEKGITK